MEPETFMARIYAARERWDRLINKLTTAQIERLQLSNGWSLKNLIIHMAWYETEMVHLLASRIFAGSPLWALPHSERNAAILAEAPPESTAELMTRHKRLFDRFSALAAELSAAELRDAVHFKDMPADWKPGELIADNAYAHYEAHLPELEAIVKANTNQG